jgi:LysM repeat protein
MPQRSNTNPDQIKVGQKLKLPNRDASGHVA